MPKLVKLYITQVLIGFAIAAGFVGMLLYFNVANLWHLVTHNDAGIIAVIVLWFANGIVFSGVQFAITIMRMADSEEDDQGGKRDDLPLAALEPVPVEVTAKRR
jgi:dolichyl-phosphate-mannose--protein O-mannosyl transferase